MIQGQGTEFLFEKLIGIERKTYQLALMQNHRGRFARLTECGNDRRAAIVIPAGGLVDVARILDAMIQADTELPEPPTGTPRMPHNETDPPPVSSPPPMI